MQHTFKRLTFCDKESISLRINNAVQSKLSTQDIICEFKTQLRNNTNHIRPHQRRHCNRCTYYIDSFHECIVRLNIDSDRVHRLTCLK